MHVLSNREELGMTTDYVAAVGGSMFINGAFAMMCTGTSSTFVTITHNDPHFSGGESREISCGSWYMVNLTFAPTTAGIITDEISFSSSLGIVTKQLIGNGVPIVDVQQWVADLSPGNLGHQLAFDGQRNLIYISDYDMNRVMIFSPETRAVVATIPVGAHPSGLALSTNHETLYVANSGEYSISVIDLNTRQRLNDLILPSLGPAPGYTPYSLVLTSNQNALVGSSPPGAASGGPIYQIDLHALTLREHPDISSGRYPQIRISTDYSTVALLREPYESPATVTRYDPVSDSALTASYSTIMSTLAVNFDGSQIIGNRGGCFGGDPEFWVLNRGLDVINRIDLAGCVQTAVAFSPVQRNLVYAAGGPSTIYEPPSLAEVDTQIMLQTRQLALRLPADFRPRWNTLVISDDGKWAYVLLNEGSKTYGPPSKLLAVNITGDYVPPMDPANTIYLPTILK